MAWDGGGNFARVHNWVNDAAADIDITASRVDAEDDNLATGIGSCLTKNGETKPTANFSPTTTRTYSLGTTSLRWTTAYLGTSINVQSATAAAATTIAFTDGTSARTITIPDATGTISLLSVAETISGDKTFSGTNTHSGLESFALTKFSTALGANYLNNAAFSAAVATNALTFTLLGEDLAAPSATNPVQIAFRSATLTTGGSTVRTATAATTVVAPSGATLGFIANEASYVYLYAIDNAGTVELAISGNPQDTSGRVTSTTIGTGSDTKATLYSTTGRTDVACRYLGKILITTGATPGEWGSAATSIHGVNETPPMWSVGYGQTWQDVTGSRAFSTTYTNSTGKPIIVQVEGGPTSTAGSFIQFTVGGVLVNSGSQVYSANAISVGSVLVPVGATYSVTASGTVALSRWVELR